MQKRTPTVSFANVNNHTIITVVVVHLLATVCLSESTIDTVSKPPIVYDDTCTDEFACSTA